MLKNMLRTDPNRVAKSTKCYMDKGSENLRGMEVSCTPIQAATSILKHLKSGSESWFKGLKKFPEVVITVPASFPEKMRKATIKAANKANLCITEKNLLEEPRAVLHYFCNQKRVVDIELNNSKILVFDLGGGTLDVSLHEVTKEGRSLTIKDITKSPYKRFGGDQFDEKVADELLTEYVHKHWIFLRTSHEMAQLRKQFQFYAEYAKIQLGYQINAIPRILSPCYLINNQPCLPTLQNLPPVNYNLSWDEYENIISDFLANDLCLESPHCSSRADNIIDPILKVLDDAKTDECPDRPKVDIVLLNGGMTKLPVIEQRLKKLFGEGVIVYSDSDKADQAVALGAIYYRASR